MDTDELSLRRSQMGHAAGLMLSDGPSPVIKWETAIGSRKVASRVWT